MGDKRLSRRSILRAAASAGPALWTISASSRRVLGANDRLDIGVIGVGGRGGSNLDAVAGENIVALCDVDSATLGAAAGPEASSAKNAYAWLTGNAIAERPAIAARASGSPRGCGS